MRGAPSLAFPVRHVHHIPVRSFLFSIPRGRRHLHHPGVASSPSLLSTSGFGCTLELSSHSRLLQLTPEEPALPPMAIKPYRITSLPLSLQLGRGKRGFLTVRLHPRRYRLPCTGNFTILQGRRHRHRYFVPSALAFLYSGGNELNLLLVWSSPTPPTNSGRVGFAADDYHSLEDPVCSAQFKAAGSARARFATIANKF